MGKNRCHNLPSMIHWQFNGNYVSFSGISLLATTKIKNMVGNVCGEGW